MATISERLAYILTFDTSQGVRSLEQVGKTADQELGKVDKNLDKLGGNLVKYGAGALAFAGVAGAGLFKMASGAADAEANMSALAQVVGDTVAQDVGEWAEDSAEGVGLASKDAVGAATSFAQLGKIVGLGGKELADFSTDLVGLSADFAAFKNVTPEQALQDIQAGFAGSTEVMRKYGIFLDDATLKTAYYRETGEKVSGTLTAQQKIIAINSELYRQGADMIGQWGRESGELAGQQAILKAELTNLSDAIGAGLLPMVTQGVTGLTAFASAVGSIDSATAGTIGKVAGFATIALGVAGALSFAAGKAILMRDRFTTLGDDGSRSLNKVGKAATGVSVALGLLAAGQIAIDIIGGIQDTAGKAARNLDQLNIAIGETAAGTADSSAVMSEFADIVHNFDREVRPSQLWESMGKSIRLVGNEIGDIPIEEFDRAFKKVLEESGVGAAQALLDAWREQSEELDKTSGQYRDNIMLIERYQERTDEAAGSAAAQSGALSDLTDKKIADASATQGLTLETEDQTAANKEAAETLDALDSKYDEAIAEIDAWAQGIETATTNGAESFNDFSVDSETSIADLRKHLQDSGWDVAVWQENLISIASRTSPEFASYLADMGAAGAPMVQELAGNDSELEGTFGDWKNWSEVTGRDMVSAFDQVGPGVTEKVQGARDQVYGEMQSQHQGWFAEAFALGSQIPAGAGAGIDSQAHVMAEKAVAAGTSALGKMRDALGIHSPSRLFASQVGEPIAEGIAQGIANSAESINEALAKSIADAEDDALDAARDLVDAVNDELDGLWGGVDDDRSLADLRVRVADAEADLAEAIAGGDAEKITRAQDALEDANYRLAKATTDMITADADSRASWRETAEAAGMVGSEIDELIEKYRELARVQKEAEAEAAAIRAEAAAAEDTRRQWVNAVNMGVISQGDLDYVGDGRADPQWTLQAMRSVLQRIFGGGRASGGPVSAGRLYEVGEGNVAEMFTAAGRQFMIPGNDGAVIPGSQIGKQPAADQTQDWAKVAQMMAREFVRVARHELRAL